MLTSYLILNSVSGFRGGGGGGGHWGGGGGHWGGSGLYYGGSGSGWDWYPAPVGYYVVSDNCSCPDNYAYKNNMCVNNNAPYDMINPSCN